MNKICTKCGEEKLLEGFHKNKPRKDGYNYICKICVSAYGRANRKRVSGIQGKHIKAQRTNNKTCSKCVVKKSLDDFYIDYRASDERCSSCKVCMCTYGRANRKRTNNAAAKKYAKTDRGKAVAIKIRTKSIVQFLKYRFSNALSHRKKIIEIDIEYLLDLYRAQNGKCAITKISMVCAIRDLRGVSINRIDSSKGYIKGNVQLVCRAINLGKQNLPNQDMIDFIDEVIKNA